MREPLAIVAIVYFTWGKYCFFLEKIDECLVLFFFTMAYLQTFLWGLDGGVDVHQRPQALALYVANLEYFCKKPWVFPNFNF